MQILSSVDSTYTTTNTNTIVPNSVVNATYALSVSFTIANTGDTNSLDYEILAGNLSDLSDGVVIQSVATVTQGDFGYYATQVAPFGYYGVREVATSAGNQTTSRILGRAKG